MAGNLPLTGDITQVQSVAGTVAGIPFPVVTKAALDDMSNTINDEFNGGKQLGATVIAYDDTAADGEEAYVLVMAEGTGNTDKWVVLGSATRTEYSTPA